MTDEATAARAAEVVGAAMDRLRSSAQTHKRLSAQHRRAAQRDMEARRELAERCRQAGIEVIIERTGG